jgi:hypothetical protein
VNKLDGCEETVSIDTIGVTAAHTTTMILRKSLRNHLRMTRRLYLPMDGRGRSMKCEAVYLRDLTDGFWAERVTG